MDLPPTFGEWKRAEVVDDVMLPRLFLAFRAPAFGTPAHYAGAIVATLLGQRRGSRLYQALVRRRELASDIGAFTWDLAKGADLLVVDATARPEVDAKALEDAVVEEIDRLRGEGVHAEELERALALIETEFVTSMQTAGDRADAISKFATLGGDPSLVNRQLERYRAVTMDDIQTFVHDRLGPENRASLVFLPRREPEAAS
jgi:predicted Zn-dependent peptidase